MGPSRRAYLLGRTPQPHMVTSRRPPDHLQPPLTSTPITVMSPEPHRQSPTSHHYMMAAQTVFRTASRLSYLIAIHSDASQNGGNPNNLPFYASYLFAVRTNASGLNGAIPARKNRFDAAKVPHSAQVRRAAVRRTAETSHGSREQMLPRVDLTLLAHSSHMCTVTPGNER